MQGPTYALCYSAIVGYAAHVAPEGYSATVQGIVAGMDDGVGKELNYYTLADPANVSPYKLFLGNF